MYTLSLSRNSSPTPDSGGWSHVSSRSCCPYQTKDEQVKLTASMEMVFSGTSVEFDVNMFESFLCSGEEQSVWLMLHCSTPGSFSLVSLSCLVFSLLHAPRPGKTNCHNRAFASAGVKQDKRTRALNNLQKGLILV